MSNGGSHSIEKISVGNPTVTQDSAGSLNINLSINIDRRNGRHLIKLSRGPEGNERPWETDPTPLQQALARGHEWLHMLESGEVRSFREIAEKEGLDNSYVSRMVNLTTLAPDIVEAILNDKLPADLTLFELAVDPPRVWGEQRELFVKKEYPFKT